MCAHARRGVRDRELFLQWAARGRGVPDGLDETGGCPPKLTVEEYGAQATSEICPPVPQDMSPRVPSSYTIVVQGKEWS